MIDLHVHAITSCINIHREFNAGKREKYFVSYFFVVNFQKRGLQHKLSVFLPLLELLEQIKERPKYQAMVLVL